MYGRHLMFSKIIANDFNFCCWGVAGSPTTYNSKHYRDCVKTLKLLAARV
jgi:hypothetical protein